MYLYLPDWLALFTWILCSCLLLLASLYLLLDLLLPAIGRLVRAARQPLAPPPTTQLSARPQLRAPIHIPAALRTSRQEALPVGPDAVWELPQGLPLPLPDGSLYLLPPGTSPAVIEALSRMWTLASQQSLPPQPQLPAPPQGTPPPSTPNAASSTSA